MGNATVSQALGEQRDCVERLSGKTGGVRSCPKSFSRTEPSMGTASTDHSQVAACSGPNSLAHSAQRFESVSPHKSCYFRVREMDVQSGPTVRHIKGCELGIEKRDEYARTAVVGTPS